jgi:hypothetical protein
MIVNAQMYNACTQPNLLSFRIFAPITKYKRNADYNTYKQHLLAIIAGIWTVAGLVRGMEWAQINRSQITVSLLRSVVIYVRQSQSE